MFIPPNPHAGSACTGLAQNDHVLRA